MTKQTLSESYLEERNLSAYGGEWHRSETIDGKIYLMARPTTDHNLVEMHIAFKFSAYFDGADCRKCSAFIEPNLYLDDKTRVEPDVVVVCDRAKIKKNGIYGAPDLVIEVLSPSTRLRDATVKKELYRRFGVLEYWLVDPRWHYIEVYKLEGGAYGTPVTYTFFADYERELLADGEINDYEFVFSPSMFPDFKIDINEIFSRITQNED